MWRGSECWRMNWAMLVGSSDGRNLGRDTRAFDGHFHFKLTAVRFGEGRS